MFPIYRLSENSGYLTCSISVGLRLYNLGSICISHSRHLEQEPAITIHAKKAVLLRCLKHLNWKRSNVGAVVTVAD